MSAFSLDSIPWDRERTLHTASGPRRIREWVIPSGHSFWRLWRTCNLRQLGYTVSKFRGEWLLTQTMVLHPRELDKRIQSSQAAEQGDALQNRIAGSEPELPPYLDEGFREVCEIYQSIRQETGDNYTYQLPSIKRLAVAIEAYDGALDASDTGTGKTFVACAVARVLNRTLFVVCPKSVIPPWKRAAYLFDVEIEIINYEMLRGGNTHWGVWQKQGRSKFFSYRNLDRESALFVFDECHRLKDYRTLQCKLGLAALNENFKVLALSATAADNPLHMKFVSLLTGLIRHPSQFLGWLAQNGVRPGKWGLQFVGGHEVISRIHRQVFPMHGSRIRVSELGDLLPQTRIISESYDMGDEATHAIQAAYREMREEIAKLEARRAADGAAAANILVQQLRARQKVELLKVPTLVQMAEDAMAEDMAVVVILNFDASIKALSKRLNTSNTVTGEDKAAVRQELLDAFNSDEEQLLVMNIKAGGVGIGVHGTKQGRSRLGLLSPTFSGIDMKQAIGRFPRAGGAPSIVKLIWAANTVEEHACKKVRARIQRVSIFNDGIPDVDLVI